MSQPIAVTLGDPRGVGPEVTLAAVSDFLARDPGARLLLIGPEGVALTDGVEYESVGPWDGSEVGAGRVSGEALRRAASLACSGRVGAVVTAPVHKPAMKAAGFSGEGQTELLRDLSGGGDVAMLMVAERTRVGAPLRVLLATRHLALRDVPAAITAELLESQTRLLHDALARHWVIERPRLALCALNPHASDGGLFGSEEAEVFRPAVEALREVGIAVEGPLPADTVFTRALAGDFDAVVAPYHDVGMAAFKTLSFGAGVNMTLGLPFVRTSPDHGTAFDIAGSGTARPDSMIEALNLARRFTL